MNRPFKLLTVNEVAKLSDFDALLYRIELEQQQAIIGKVTRRNPVRVDPDNTEHRRKKCVATGLSNLLAN